MTGRMFNRDNELTLALEQQQNNLPPVHSHFRLNRRNLNLDLNITTSDQNNLHVTAAMPPDALHFEVTRTHLGRSESDVLFHVGLREPQLLRSRLLWRPQLLEDIKDTVSEKYEDAADVIIVTKDKVYVEAYDEFNYKVDRIEQAMLDEIKPFTSEMSSDMDRLRYDVDKMNNEIRNAYRRNEFYSKTIMKAAETSFKYTSEIVSAAGSKVTEATKKAAHYVSKAYDYAKDGAEDLLSFTIRLGKKTSVAIKKMLISIGKRVASVIDAASKRLIQLLEKIGDYVYEALAKYAPSLKQKIQQLYQDAMELFESTLSRLYQSQYYKTAVKYYRETVKAIKEFLRLPLYEHYKKIRDAIYDYMEKIQRFHDEYLRDKYLQAYEKASKLYRDLGLDALLGSVADAAYQRIKSLALTSLQEFVDDYVKVRSGFRYEFEPRNGRIVIDVPLPSPKSSLREALDPTTYPEVEKLSQLKTAVLSSENYFLSDTYYKYKRYFQDSLKSPPFDTYAMIAGNQHYITFDKFHFDFVGECSYLLTRDFVDGNFTIAVNYARDGEDIVRKSLTIIIDDKKIEFGSDYKVTVDDAKVELPYALKSSFVTREGSVITLESDKGFAVRCNFIHEICTVHLSGYYFGKTGGLFGTYDYEPLLDTMTSQRLLEKEIDEFADSWKVGNAVCRKENLAVTRNNDHRAKQECEKLFRDNRSIFRPCHKIIDPTEYYEMCLRDLAGYGQSMFDRKICSSSAAYTTECNVAGVPIRMPHFCVRCEKHDGKVMNSGDVIKITDTEKVQSADVVFVIEKKACNKNKVEMLKRLAQALEDSLRDEGYKNIRYAVVGFGGAGIFEPPHLQTSDGQEFANIRSIGSAFTAMGTIGRSSVTRSSVFEAIRYSASLPFRAGSTKTFILMKCSECKAEEVKADYSEMLRTLLDGDITLHLLMEQVFETKDSSKGKKIPNVMGVDKTVAYTQKDVKDPNLSGDRDLFLQLRIPKDFCVPLALEVNGSVFGSQMLTDTKRGMNKKFVDVLSRRTAKTAKPSDCQVCECISTLDGIGRSVCQRCVSPVVGDMIPPEIMYPLETPYRGDSKPNKPKGKRRVKE